MRLELDHHRIEPLTREHLDAFVAYRQDPRIARYQSWAPSFSHVDGEALLAAQSGREFPTDGEWVQLGIIDAGTARLDGDVAVHAFVDQPDTYELGITLAPHAHGHGLATAALRSVAAELFTAHGAHRVIATSDERNEPVRRTLTRAGFRHEGTLVEADWLKGEWTTVELWAMLDAPGRSPGGGG